MNAEQSAPRQTASGYQYDDAANHPAGKTAPIIVSLIKHKLAPGSVLDVGCGIGFWLREFQRQGIADFTGLDGEWVLPHLVIDREKLRVCELTKSQQLGRKYDLVMCLEVAEHLPAFAADTLIGTLVAHADTVCFSAAIPQQGGFEHVNEQPQSYWAKKFLSHGYKAYDLLRHELWDNPDVPYYYAQNILIYSKRELAADRPVLFDVVHPELLVKRTDPRGYSLLKIAKHIPYYVIRTGRKLLRF